MKSKNNLKSKNKLCDASFRRKTWLRLCSDWQIYVFILPTLTYFIVFHYLPMYGIQIAFKDYVAVKGILESPWVGLKHFRDFFDSYYCSRLFINTLLLNIYGLIWGFPIPIFLALLINQINSKRFKSFTQTIIYIPHFISSVVLIGMLYMFLSPTSGVFNKIIQLFGGEPIYFLSEAKWFRTLFIGSSIWQDAGWSSILYIAALTGIDQQMYEAATIDGANTWQKIFHIEIPSILPIATMMLILSCGGLLNSNTEKALLLQTSGNIATSDIIGVYVYNVGLGGGQYSYTSAIGLFLNIINFLMIITVNSISKRVGETSLF